MLLTTLLNRSFNKNILCSCCAFNAQIFFSCRSFMEVSSSFCVFSMLFCFSSMQRSSIFCFSLSSLVLHNDVPRDLFPSRFLVSKFFGYSWNRDRPLKLTNHLAQIGSYSTSTARWWPDSQCVRFLEASNYGEGSGPVLPGADTQETGGIVMITVTATGRRPIRTIPAPLIRLST